MKTPSIDIVVATFNGEQYIKAQIESIQRSLRYTELVSRIIIVDDGSTDNTIDLIKALQKDDDRIELHINGGSARGAKGNFGYGISLTSAEFIMLCDQDDIWRTDKIVKSFEKLCSSALPSLVFSDKRIVDAELNEICPSFFQLRNIRTDWHESLERLLQQNVASGCTMMFNRALLNAAMPIPEEAFMHDWWLILVAKTIGEVHFIDAPTVDYRQHDTNTIGAKNHSVLYLIKNFSRHLHKFQVNFWQSASQANALAGKVNSDELANISFTSVIDFSYWQRLNMFFKGNIKQHNWKGQFALFLTLLLSKGS